MNFSGEIKSFFLQSTSDACKGKGCQERRYFLGQVAHKPFFPAKVREYAWRGCHLSSSGASSQGFPVSLSSHGDRKGDPW